MKVTTPYRWSRILSLVTISAVFAGATPPVSWSATDSGAAESSPGGSFERAKPAKPRGTNADETMLDLPRPDMPGRTPVPRQRRQALEERLRRGEMEKPIPQGEMSDRLDQLYKGSAKNSSGETGAGERAN
jgi:hypothetical protein